MALISNAKGRREEETPSGYERLFGNRKLGMLLSKCHATVISSGNELERFLATKLTKTDGISIDKINKENRILKGIKRGKNLEVDIVIKKGKEVYLIELKDGDTFDTKKVAGEVESLIMAKDHLIKKGIPEKDIKIKFCSFNATSHEQVKIGAKGLLPKDSAMTGKELCELLNLDFNKIVEERKEHQKENTKFFVNELKKIHEISEEFKEIG